MYIKNKNILKIIIYENIYKKANYLERIKEL